ncbi:nuclear transport factor 2 family protein [Actinomycetospora callitridis]|uniref:nuclear transport factor 2 family protein n=1 Tax=Actinomycetospora callitridis TaxID=913944 RepID=UPI0023662972|nr:hypothetical protein [Actinomycetospora callitridis]MDD7919795.1 hypothetical protein [Actinomycetospora callitridis]
MATLVVAIGAVWWMATASTSTPAPVASSATASTGPAAPLQQVGPATVDSEGRPMPPAASDGARRLYSALEANDMSAVRAVYAPDDTAASWSTLRTRLSPEAVRDGLLEALRHPPQPRPEVDYLYASGDYGVGLTDTGRVAFVGTGQRAAATATPTERAPSPGSRTVPFECEDSFVGDGLQTPACDGQDNDARPSHCSADLETCPTGYREGVTSSANPYGCNFDAISAENPCQWRYEDQGDRPNPVTAAQRWAVCHLSGYREFC